MRHLPLVLPTTDRSFQLQTNDARLKIIQAANRYKLTFSQIRGYTPTLFGSRHIQQAVCVCRRNLLVDEATLIEAGFNAKAR